MIPGIINPDLVALPLINSTQWRAYLFEVFLIETFSIQLGTLGVILFFLIIGYLMPMMCDRHTRKAFLVNRFFRIFPTLVAAMAMLGFFLNFTQGITFDPKSFLASISLTYIWLGVVPMAGVLWALVIEVTFYLLVVLLSVFNLREVLLAYSTLQLVILLGVLYQEHYYLWLAGHQARVLLFILIGSAFFLAEKEQTTLAKLAILLPSIVFSYIGFQLFKLGKVDASTYENLGTHLLSMVIFVSFHQLGPVLLKRLPKQVSAPADLVYPFYLTHAAIGLVTIAFVCDYIQQPYPMLLLAILASLLSAWLLHQFIEKPSINFGRRFKIGG